MEQGRLSGADPAMRALPAGHTGGMNARAMLLLIASMPVALSGCTQMQIKRLATPDGSEVYELRGRDPARLAAIASQQCIHGYDTLRQSQKSGGMESDLKPAQWWNTAASYLDDAGAQAQLLVSCKAAPVAPAATVAPPVATDGSAK